MSEQESDRSTAADRIPLEHGRDQLPRQTLGLNRRQSRTIVPPRKWRKLGLNTIVCPECRATVPSIPDGFWHLQTAHNQGDGVDLEQWGRELRAELDEYIEAGRGRRGYVEERESHGVENLAAILLGVIVIMAVIGVVYVVMNLHQG